jgi:hypothetical protein
MKFLLLMSLLVSKSFSAEKSYKIENTEKFANYIEKKVLKYNQKKKKDKFNEVQFMNDLSFLKWPPGLSPIAPVTLSACSFGKGSLYATTGDFNYDSKKDIFIYLTDTKKSRVGLWFCDGFSNECNLTRDYMQGDIGLGKITKEKHYKSCINGMDNPCPPKFNSPVLSVIGCESASGVAWWDKKSKMFKFSWTSD